jgi:hypothetical protein
MKFSIRDLLLVTVIVALAIGWCLDHWLQRLEVQRAQESQIQSEEYLEDVIKLVEGMGLGHNLRSPKK